jgi:NADPH-dependent 2,4-dienoyl-CoA reductase/sulfur reductase-like enzyme
MYSLADCKRIISESRKGLQAVVIGGGLLGAELAEVWRHAGLAVTFLVLEPWYFPKGLSEPQGRIVETEIRRHGCDLHMAEEVSEFTGNGCISKLRTMTGSEFDADIVGITIGTVPRIDFAKSSNVEIGRGVIVDRTLRTSRRDVFAAGDCAEITLNVSGPTLIEQLWYSADRQGQVAGRNMCGDVMQYDAGVFYNTAKFFDLDYVSVGTGKQPEDGLGDETEVARSGRASRRFILRGDVVSGITSIGFDDDPKLVMEIVSQGASLRQAKARLGESRWHL